MNNKFEIGDTATMVFPYYLRKKNITLCCIVSRIFYDDNINIMVFYKYDLFCKMKGFNRQKWSKEFQIDEHHLTPSKIVLMEKKLNCFELYI